MKIKIKNMAIIGMIGFGFINLIAQTVPTTNGGATTSATTMSAPDKLPIGSLDELQAYAWERVAYIGMSSWAESVIRSTTTNKDAVWLTYTKTNGVVDVDEVFGLIKVQQLGFSVLYQSDTIKLNTLLYDQYGNYSFHSYSEAGINTPQNGVSKNTLDVELNLAPEIWISYPDALGIQIIVRDANNNPIWYYSGDEYGMENGGFRFPAYFAGKKGELIVTMKDWTQVAYNLDGGKKIIPTNVQIGVGNVSGVGVRTFRGTNIVSVKVSYNEFFQQRNPVSQLIVTNKTGLATSFVGHRVEYSYKDGSPLFMEFASSVKIWPQGRLSTKEDANNIGQPTSGLTLNVPYGRYWVSYGYASGWPTSVDQGGKGMLATPVTPVPATQNK